MSLNSDPIYARDVLTNVLMSLAVTFLGTFAIAYYLLCDLPEIVQ
jgi:hypothetical protein